MLCLWVERRDEEARETTERVKQSNDSTKPTPEKNCLNISQKDLHFKFKLYVHPSQAAGKLRGERGG